VFGYLGDDPVRQPEYNPLIDAPRLEGVSEGLIAQPDDGRWFIVPLALRAKSYLALVPRNQLSAAVPGES
jgi:hypothetical protein